MSEIASQPKIAVVTGANRGLGYALIEQLAHHLYPNNGEDKFHLNSDSPSSRWIVYLASRDAIRGAKAVSQLNSKLQSLPENQRAEVRLLALDVLSKESVLAAVAELRARHGQVHLLVQNAGVIDQDDLWKTYNTNFISVLQVTMEMKPILAKNARILNVASIAGFLHYSALSAPEKEDFDAVSTIEQLTSYATAHREVGFTSFYTIYQYSKALVILLSRILAREFAEDGISVLAACPGWCRSELAANTPRIAEIVQGEGFYSVEQGAIFLLEALSQIRQKSGHFFATDGPSGIVKQFL